MKQSIDEAAYDYATEKTKFRKDVLKEVDADTYVSRHADSMEDFQYGADWQAKQMAWVSVNDKMPEDGHTVDSKTVYAHTKDVIVLYKNGVIGKGRRIYVSGINKKGWQWSCLKGEDITHWMNHPD